MSDPHLLQESLCCVSLANQQLSQECSQADVLMVWVPILFTQARSICRGFIVKYYFALIDSLFKQDLQQINELFIKMVSA